MSPDNLVSVYITTKNRVSLLERAFNSVCAQTYPNIEVIIINDGSSDRTESFLCELEAKFNHVVCINNKVSMGACAARNQAIEIANGKFITGLDDDDEFTPTRVSDLLTAYESSKVSFVCSNFLDSYGSHKKTHENMKCDSFRSLENLKYSNLASNQILTETYKLKSIGGFDVKFKRLQDWDTWFRLCQKHGRFLKLKAPSYIMHHEHEGPRVSENLTFSDSLSRFIEKHGGSYSAIEYDKFMLQICYLKSELVFSDIPSLIKNHGLLRATKWFLLSSLNRLKALN